MSLFEEHKAERRGRILAAARALIAERGYGGLTMRDLARASRVSVPTLYNLFGGKQALLLGELEETFAVVVRSLEQARGGNFVERALATCEAGNEDLLAAPRYSHELIHVFLTAEETRPIRREMGERYAQLMAGILRDGQAAGELEPGMDVVVVARRMFAYYIQTMIEWGQGELDANQFRAATLYGLCLMLLGLARGRAREQLAERVRSLEPAVALGNRGRRRTRKGG
jgi:AcrR family transcriptional regulator